MQFGLWQAFRTYFKVMEKEQYIAYYYDQSLSPKSRPQGGPQWHAHLNVIS